MAMHQPEGTNLYRDFTRIAFKETKIVPYYSDEKLDEIRTKV